jgi:hypothetical protein
VHPLFSTPGYIKYSRAPKGCGTFKKIINYQFDSKDLNLFYRVEFYIENEYPGTYRIR